MIKKLHVYLIQKMNIKLIMMNMNIRNMMKLKEYTLARDVKMGQDTDGVFIKIKEDKCIKDNGNRV